MLVRQPQAHRIQHHGAQPRPRHLEKHLQQRESFFGPLEAVQLRAQRRHGFLGHAATLICPGLPSSAPTCPTRSRSARTARPPDARDSAHADVTGRPETPSSAGNPGHPGASRGIVGQIVHRGRFSWSRRVFGHLQLPPCQRPTSCCEPRGSGRRRAARRVNTCPGRSSRRPSAPGCGRPPRRQVRAGRALHREARTRCGPLAGRGVPVRAALRPERCLRQRARLQPAARRGRSTEPELTSCSTVGLEDDVVRRRRRVGRAARARRGVERRRPHRRAAARGHPPDRAELPPDADQAAVRPQPRDPRPRVPAARRAAATQARPATCTRRPAGRSRCSAGCRWTSAGRTSPRATPGRRGPAPRPPITTTSAPGSAPPSTRPPSGRTTSTRGRAYAQDGLQYAAGTSALFLASVAAVDLARCGRIDDAREALHNAKRTRPSSRA